jgi:hypothetical protein
LHPLGSELNFVKSPHDSLLPDRHCLVATRKVSLLPLFAHLEKLKQSAQG